MPTTTRDCVLLAAGHNEEVSRWVIELQNLGMTTEVVENAEKLGVSAGDNPLLVHCESFPEDPVEVISHLREEGYRGEVVAVTASPSISEAVALMGLGCYDYLPASLSADRVAQHLAEALGLMEQSRPQYELLWKNFRKRSGWQHVHSASHACQKGYMLAAQAAPSEATVLIEGETGTGKEYLARALHFMSPRRDKPFVAVNCGAIPETLLESELFGHERGAFTSATRAKPGLCETAHRGTVFLDEIGDMSPSMQIKMLRFVQDKSFVRVGGLETIKVDVRIIAATNQDLRRAVREVRFREDLYYRLAVIDIWLPPLRERLEDLPRFVEFFLGKHAVRMGRKHFCDCALNKLRQHNWPGNLRELENVVHRAILTSPHRNIHAEHVGLDEPLIPDQPPRLFPLAAVR